MYVIQSGKCIIEKGGVEVAMCGPRDFFGERVLVLVGTERCVRPRRCGYVFVPDALF